MAAIKVLFLLAYFSTIAYGYRDCKVDLKYDSLWERYTHNKTKDTFGSNQELKRIQRLEITDVIVLNGKYINATIEKDEIVFTTSTHFNDMEKEVANYYYEREVRSDIEFRCEEGDTTIEFELPVEDINTHVPNFNRKVYTYKFGMNVPKGFVLTSLMEILATDIDILDSDLIFETESDAIKITNGYYNDDLDKTHSATVTVEKDITTTTTAQIKVRDEREENKFGVADVKIVISK